MTTKRPFGVTLLLYLVLILSAWGGIRFAAALRWWEMLNEFDAHLSPLYLSATGAIWSAAGLVLFWGALTRKPWSQMAILAVMIIWQLELWIERIFFLSSSPNLAFAITVSCVLLAVIVFTTLHPGTRYYLNKSEEHEQSDQHPKTA